MAPYEGAMGAVARLAWEFVPYEYDVDEEYAVGGLWLLLALCDPWPKTLDLKMLKGDILEKVWI